MFSNFFLKSFRILLLPFALLYWLAISIRNFLYNKRIIKSANFGLPVICIGNLSVGGTGKSPMIEYLVDKLKNKYKIATLSRGYKRKTKGYALANEKTTALDIGDEPMQFHLKFPDIAVAVGEERIEAIPQLLHDIPSTQAILLDDAFQHRKIKAGLNVLLTDYSNLFTRDFYLPTGDLRDNKSSYKRADIIIITKCKTDLSEIEKKEIIDEIKPLPHQTIFFTKIVYGTPYHIRYQNKISLNLQQDVLLVTGIANPRPLKKKLETESKEYYLMQFADHHIFSIDDLHDIKNKFEAITGQNKIILTTEKDAVRLAKFNDEIGSLPLFVLPIQHQFLFEEGDRFDNLIENYISNFEKSIKPS